MENEKPKGGGMEKLASFIVDKRNLFFLLYIFALIFSVIATGWVKVEDDITTYLPDTTETRQGLTVMNDNFVTYGTANVMVSNITYDTALDIQSRLEDIEGVTTVEFDDTDEHYTNASALFSVSFDAEVGDERAENALQEIRDELEGSYDTSIYSEVGYDSSADLQSEMVVIVIIAAIIIVVVLTLTSRSYAEVPVLLMTFGAAALLNMGTNFLCGTISFISNSVTWPSTTPSFCATVSAMSMRRCPPARPALPRFPRLSRRFLPPRSRRSAAWPRWRSCTSALAATWLRS